MHFDLHCWEKTSILDFDISTGLMYKDSTLKKKCKKRRCLYSEFGEDEMERWSGMNMCVEVICYMNIRKITSG